MSTDPSSPVVTSIANWEIPLYWNRIVTLLSRVVVRDEVDNSLEDVRQFLLTGSMQAWHVDWQAILVTQIQPYGANPQQPTSKVCCVVFCAGDRLDEWLQSAGERIGTWARAMGCTKLRIVGRKGWVVKLPDYKQVSITLEKQL